MSLPMPSGSCWTKRTTESNRTAPENLRGFFCAIPASGRIMPQNSPTPPNPLTIGFPTTQAQAQTHTPQPFGPLSSPSPASPFPHGSPIQARSQSKTRYTPHFPTTQAQTRTPQPPSPLSSPLTNSPIPAWLSYPSPAPPKRSPTRPALPYHADTDTHGPAAQPAIYPVYQLPHSRTSLQLL